MAILKFSKIEDFENKIKGYRAYIEAEVDDYNNIVKQKIVIPSYYNGEPVVTIGRSSAAKREIDLVLPDTIEMLESDSLSALNIKKLIIPKSVKFIDFLAIASSFLEEIIIDSDNQNFKIIDNVIYSKDEQILIFYLSNKKSKIFEIPEKVKKIEKGAFYGSKYIEEVFFPDNNVEKIYSYTFSNCERLKKVTISEGVKEISNYAFAECEKLEEVYLPATLINMGKHVFKKTDKAKIYCSFEKPGENWPKSWCNNEENVFLNYVVDNNVMQIDNKQTTYLSKANYEFSKGSNLKETCEKAYEEWFISVNNISDNQFKNDILNSVSVLMLYLTKIDDASVDIGLINELVEKTFSKYKKVLKDLDCLEEKQIQDLINFMLFISKYDEEIYKNTICLLIILSASKGIASKKIFDFIGKFYKDKDSKYNEILKEIYEKINQNFIPKNELLTDKETNSNIKKAENDTDACNNYNSENSDEAIQSPIKIFDIKLFNMDFNGCCDLINSPLILKELLKKKGQVFKNFLRLSKEKILPNPYRGNIDSCFDIDSWLELFSLFEKHGFNINTLRDLGDANLFTMIVISFVFVNNKSDYEKLKKMFYYLLYNSKIKKDTVQKFWGHAIDIFENILNDEICPDRLKMAGDLDKILKKEDDVNHLHPKISTIYGTAEVDVKSKQLRFLSDKTVEVKYKEDKKSFGIVIVEKSQKVETKAQKFEVPVNLKYTSDIKSETFDYSGLKYSWDNCRYIGTSSEDTFTILLNGIITLFGYTGDIKMELALHMSSRQYFKIDCIVLDDVEYKYNGNYLDLNFKFSIKYK